MQQLLEVAAQHGRDGLTTDQLADNGPPSLDIVMMAGTKESRWCRAAAGIALLAVGRSAQIMGFEDSFG